MTDILCHGCKTFAEAAYIQPLTEREFCRACALMQPLTTEDWTAFLLMSPHSVLGPQFHPGDVVECRTAAIVYDGVGTIAEMSMSLKHGGTPIYPTFRVVLDEKAHDEAPDEAWYTEVCLRKVTQEASS